VTGAGHREIDHTADLGFELWAPALEELFAEGVKALGEVCYDLAAVRAREQRTLRVTGHDAEERLVRWLQEVYLILEAEMWLSASAREVTIVDDVVEGVVRGEPFDRGRHTIHTEIKAITYHGLSVRREGALWRATVVVDV
jgi:SHS2 domain-containing protein